MLSHILKKVFAPYLNVSLIYDFLRPNDQPWNSLEANIKYLEIFFHFEMKIVKELDKKYM